MFKTINKPPNYTLILTACIDPVGSNNGKVSVKRHQVDKRLQDYLNALKFWLHCQDQRIKKILFIDNSGYSLDKLIKLSATENIFNRQCEFVSMNNNEVIEGLSYGYSEFKLLDEGIARSKLINQDDYLIKATGRYIFPDISKLLNRLPDQFSFAADSIKDYPLLSYKPKGVKFRGSRTKVALFVSKAEFYNSQIRKIYQELIPYDWQEKAFIETWLFKKLQPIKKRQNVILRFPCNCDPLGIGGNNTNYSSPKQKIIRLCRQIGRTVIPQLWF